MTIQIPTWAACTTCMEYAERRRAALSPYLADLVQSHGTDAVTEVNAYMAKVHDRHLTGLPLYETSDQ